MDITKKKLIVFDLDGTLTESKCPMEAEMAQLLGELLKKGLKISIISGGAFGQFEKQLSVLKLPEKLLLRLFFFPTTGTIFYRYENGWKEMYADEIPLKERERIKDAFEKAFKDVHYEHPKEVFGEIVEDRRTQVTFSALGQQAPLKLKLELREQWRATQDPRIKIVEALKKYIPEFEIKIPGVTSIDVTKYGITKAYGVRQMVKYLDISIDDMVFVGDALYEGGNDSTVKETGIECVEVSGPADTQKLLRSWLQKL